MTISTDGKGGSTGHEEAGGGEAGGTRRDFGNQVGGIDAGGVLAAVFEEVMSSNSVVMNYMLQLKEVLLELVKSGQGQHL